MEDDIAKFLGISKSLAKAKGTKLESFKGRFLSAYSRTFIGDDFLILAPKDVRREGSKTYIKYVKNPYTPVKVYKALVKFALSVLPGDKVKQSFAKALAFLNDKVIIEHGAALSWYTLPFNTLPLYVLIFQKKNTEASLPTYMISFYFNNYIFNLPLLMHENDVWNDDQCEIIIPPPYFGNKNYLEVPIQFNPVRDFASKEKVTDECEELTFTMPDETRKHLWAYNPETDQTEQRSYDGTGIKYIIITKEGVTVDPKAFSEFIKKTMEGDRGSKPDSKSMES